MAFQSWGNFEKPENPEIFVNEIQGEGPERKLSRFSKISENLKAGVYIILFQFLHFGYNFLYTIS